MKRKLFVDIIAALFVILFLYASISKLLDYEKFRVQLGQSPLLTAYAGWISWVIPTIEISIAILLSISRFRLFALHASFLLMVMFSTYIVVITHFSDYVPCSCGGILQKMDWNQHLVFNLSFVLLSIISIYAFKDNDMRSHENKP